MAEKEQVFVPPFTPDCVYTPAADDVEAASCVPAAEEPTERWKAKGRFYLSLHSSMRAKIFRGELILSGNSIAFPTPE